MDERSLIVARLAYARIDLMEAVGRLTDELLPWAPASGMRTVAGQIVEIAGTEIQLIARLKGEDDIDWEEAQALIGDPTSLDRLKTQLTATRAATLGYLASLSDADLAKAAPIPTRWNESMGLPSVPIGEVLRSIAQHEAYHTGQLVSYLWAHGDDPYQWP